MGLVILVTPSAAANPLENIVLPAPNGPVSANTDAPSPLFLKKVRDIRAPTSIVSSSDLVVFPNPTKGLFTISLKESSNQPLTVSVYTLDGKLVYSKDNAFSTANQLEIDLGEVAKGVYSVLVKGESFNYTSSVIIE